MQRMPRAYVTLLCGERVMDQSMMDAAKALYPFMKAETPAKESATQPEPGDGIGLSEGDRQVLKASLGSHSRSIQDAGTYDELKDTMGSMQKPKLIPLIEAAGGDCARIKKRAGQTAKGEFASVAMTAIKKKVKAGKP